MSLPAQLDTVSSAAKVEELQATSKSLLEEASWMNWWLVAVRPYVNFSSSLEPTIFVGGSRVVEFMIKMAVMIWSNFARRNVASGKLSNELSHKNKISLRNNCVPNYRTFPGRLRKITWNSIQDVAVHKVFSFNKVLAVASTFRPCYHGAL